MFTEKIQSKIQNELIEVQKTNAVQNLAPGTRCNSGESSQHAFGTKELLIKFLGDEWKKPKYSPKFMDKKICCYTLIGDEFVEVVELNSTMRIQGSFCMHCTLPLLDTAQ